MASAFKNGRDSWGIGAFPVDSTQGPVMSFGFRLRDGPQRNKTEQRTAAGAHGCRISLYLAAKMEIRLNEPIRVQRADPVKTFTAPTSRSDFSNGFPDTR